MRPQLPMFSRTCEWPAESGAPGGLAGRLLGATLLGGAGAGRRGAGGAAALHPGARGEGGAGGAVRRVAGPHLPAVVAGVGAEGFPVVQLDETLERPEQGGHGGGGGAVRRGVGGAGGVGSGAAAVWEGPGSGGSSRESYRVSLLGFFDTLAGKYEVPDTFSGHFLRGTSVTPSHPPELASSIRGHL